LDYGRQNTVQFMAQKIKADCVYMETSMKDVLQAFLFLFSCGFLLLVWRQQILKR